VTVGLLIAAIAVTSACHRAWHRHHYRHHHSEAPAEGIDAPMPAMAPGEVA